MGWMAMRSSRVRGAMCFAMVVASVMTPTRFSAAWRKANGLPPPWYWMILLSALAMESKIDESRPAMVAGSRPTMRDWAIATRARRVVVPATLMMTSIVDGLRDEIDYLLDIKKSNECLIEG